MNLLGRFKQKLEVLLFPYLCVLCLKPSDLSKDLCSACGMSLPKVGLSCQQCGNRWTAFFEEAVEGRLVCGQCLKCSPSYNEVLSLYEYAFPVDRWIQQLKFRKNLVYARLLGELMAEFIAVNYQNRTLPQCIIPVPLYSDRLRQRGFNQSLELARPIAKKMDISLEPFLYRRIRNTLQQSSIPLDQRKKNVEGAFIKVGHKSYQRVAILDDVVTTGFTIEALSKALKVSGVEEVVVWCCARTCC